MIKIDKNDLKNIDEIKISNDILNYIDKSFIPNYIYDISALQHASDTNWIEGVKIILDYGINNVQGQGSYIINKNKFYDYYNNCYKKN